MMRHQRLRVLSFLLATVWCAMLKAQVDTAANVQEPAWRLRVQAAGYQGLLSIGGGPVLWKGRWQPALMYGWAPPTDRRKAIHSVIIRNDLVPGPVLDRGPWSLSPAFSMNLLIDTGGHSFLVLPKEYPRGYYTTTALHATFGLGARLAYADHGHEGLPQAGLSVELVTLDTYAWYAIDQRTVPFSDAFSMSIALDILF